VYNKCRDFHLERYVIENVKRYLERKGRHPVLIKFMREPQ